MPCSLFSHLKREKMSKQVIRYSPSLQLNLEERNAVARQLLGLHKQYDMKSFHQASKVMIPRSNGQDNDTVVCSQKTINDLSSGLDE